MICKKCQSDRVLNFSGKCNDTFSMSLKDKYYEGYIPSYIGIGGGDYLKMKLCLDCGTVVGNFPIEKIEIEQDQSEEEDV
jgi:hypothetical protein